MEKEIYRGPSEGFFKWSFFKLHMAASDIHNQFGIVEELTSLLRNDTYSVDVRYGLQHQNVVLSYVLKDGEVAVSVDGAEEGIGEIERIVSQNMAVLAIIQKQKIRPEVIEALAKSFEEEERMYLDSDL